MSDPVEFAMKESLMNKKILGQGPSKLFSFDYWFFLHDLHTLEENFSFTFFQNLKNPHFAHKILFQCQNSKGIGLTYLLWLQGKIFHHFFDLTIWFYHKRNPKEKYSTFQNILKSWKLQRKFDTKGGVFKKVLKNLLKSVTEIC